MNAKRKIAPVHILVVPDTENAVTVSPTTEGWVNSLHARSLPKLRKHGTDRLNALHVTEEENGDGRKC